MVYRYKKKKFIRSKGRKKIYSSNNTLKSVNLNIEGYMKILNPEETSEDLALSISLNHPTFLLNQGGTWGQMDGVATLLNKANGMFNEYRVNSLTVRFISTYTQTAPTGTGGPDTPMMMYHYNDINDLNLLSEARALNGGVLPTPINNGRMYTFKFKQPHKAYTNTDSFAASPDGTPDNDLILPPNHYASMKFFLPNADPTTWIGRIFCKWNVTYRGIDTSQA